MSMASWFAPGASLVIGASLYAPTGPAPRRVAHARAVASPTDSIADVGGHLRSALTAVTRGQSAVDRGTALIDDRRLALVVGASLVSVALRWWLAPLILLGSVALAWRSRRRADAIAQQRRNDAAPFLIDLVRAGLAAGADPRTTLLALGTTDVGRPVRALQPSLRELTRRLGAGEPFHDALALLGRASPDLRALVAALQSSERLGVGVGPTLDILAVDARLTRRRRAETRARRLPVLLLFPLTTCILPAFGVLTVVPLLVSGLSAVRW